MYVFFFVSRARKPKFPATNEMQTRNRIFRFSWDQGFWGFWGITIVCVCVWNLFLCFFYQLFYTYAILWSYLNVELTDTWPKPYKSHSPAGVAVKMSGVFFLVVCVCSSSEMDFEENWKKWWVSLEAVEWSVSVVVLVPSSILWSFFFKHVYCAQWLPWELLSARYIYGYEM